ncbi:citrate synthase [Mariniphaga anaerophila]|uniref:citrate synthase (unknown stereospecificity) n=1 Tax=Mariniphaga anaerophila TaxID=1484053 RepID=A0A1M4XTH5_9BACT|nr:citrate (Si)-synthase [Mariniphaga anaerophila]SHE96646.1 citrate synthase [Mariniphaga anaerophila]
MEYIKYRFFEKASKCSKEFQRIKNQHADKVIAQVTLGQVLTGMKGIPLLVTDTSKLDPNEGIRFKGYSIPELREKLPKIAPDGEPLPEGLFYLMLIGEIPTQEDVANLSKDFATRAHVPQHVFDVIDAMPKNSRPMTQFSAAILAMATESIFQKAYRAGVNKKYYWDSTYEDVMNLIARLPHVAAYIYRRNFHNEQHIEPNPRLDWAGNLSHMMGFDSEDVKRLFRLYMVIHADHEGGNVSAHTAHLVGSALSNPYYAYAAAMTGLAGPLHGFANQDVIHWIFQMTEDLDTETPTDEQVAAYIKQTMEEGRVIPGYGHAVLRKTDPRFTAQQEFAEKYIKDDPMINLVNQLYRVVPPILSNVGKIKNPWPNVDAFSGSLLYHYGIKEYTFYTVLFGVSRALGVLASLINDRVYGMPIERPTSHPLHWYRDMVDGDNGTRC